MSVEGAQLDNPGRQQGLSLIGFILLLIVVVFVAYLGLKLVPIYLNHMSVVSDMKSVAETDDISEETPHSIRRNLIRRLNMSYVKHVEAENIRIEHREVRSLVVKYDVHRHLIGNIDVVVRFERAVALE